ncbi:GTPase IMAP family member 4-like [Cottoperca gobio]|uniref:GTPase IMAP family member 4-like n=1 Tax=Cottoperca gobio TaxID=56716 RepID=A0A6J2RLB7_COTGO|nr:GTPase IMAP family member 4-like [Cottoperca gobio]
MWIDTPGFFDTDRPEEELKPEIVKCITECTPGPHVFLIVLKVEKYTEQEKNIINKLQQCFSEEALTYAIVLFTHGDQLPEGKKIEQWVDLNTDLRDLMKKCGRRFHVIDNKYWKNKQHDEYRSNQFQVAELLKTIDKMVEANKGSCYTNEMLQAVEEEIQQEEKLIKESNANKSGEEIRAEAKSNVQKRLFIAVSATAVSATVLLGCFLGLKLMKDRMLITGLGLFLSKYLPR